MSDSIFKFCPRCGAVTKNLICDNCGYNLEASEEYAEYLEEKKTEEQEYSESYNIGNNSDGYSNVQMPKKKKNLWWLWALIAVAALGILLFVVCGLVLSAVIIEMGIGNYIAASQVASNNISAVGPVNPAIPDVDDDEDIEEEEDDEDENPSVVYDNEYDYIVASGFNVYDYDYDEMKDYLEEANEWTDEVSDEKTDYFFSDYFVSWTGKEHVPMTKSDFNSPYFEFLADYYDDSYDYDVERRYVRVEGNMNGVFCNLYGAYYVIESDDVDYSDVNDELKKRVYQNLYRIVSDVPKDYENKNYVAYSDSYITYNSDELLSVVYDDFSYLGNYSESIFYSSVNVDMKNAEVLDNNNLVNIDDDFVEFFVERSNIQNNYVYAINNNSTEKVKEVFEDPYGLILFFTPVGMEIGINYRYGGTYGWVTITLNDFDQYLTDEFEFDTSYAGDFDEFKYEEDNGLDFDGVEIIGGDDFFELDGESEDL